MKRYPANMADFMDMFPTEDACLEYLSIVRWPGGYKCLRCGKGDYWTPCFGSCSRGRPLHKCPSRQSRRFSRSLPSGPGSSTPTRSGPVNRIVELLSLSRESRGRNRGRISYVNLGISQLGAVYELLLSFSGFFAAENLIELKPKDQPNPGPLEAAYFAPERRATEFEQAEIVYDGSSPRKYSRGTFIYRLSGRNRENSPLLLNAGAACAHASQIRVEGAARGQEGRRYSRMDKMLVMAFGQVLAFGERDDVISRMRGNRVAAVAPSEPSRRPISNHGAAAVRPDTVSVAANAG